MFATLSPFSASWEMYRTPTGRPTFPGMGIIGVISWQKTLKNRGQSASSPRCLNAVNPAVGLSAPKYYLPEKTCGKRTRGLTGALLTSGCAFRMFFQGPGILARKALQRGLQHLRHLGLLSDWPRFFRVFCHDFTLMIPMPGKVGRPVGVRYISLEAEKARE